VTRLLTMAELADVLRVSPRTVQRLLSRGVYQEHVHYVRIGRLVRFRQVAIDATMPSKPRSRRPAVSDAILADMR